MCWWLMAFWSICVKTETTAAPKYPKAGSVHVHMEVKNNWSTCKSSDAEVGYQMWVRNKNEQEVMFV